MLLKTYGEIMSETGLSIISMKIRQIEAHLHYVDQKKAG
jgi:hypothetical protein